MKKVGILVSTDDGGLPVMLAEPITSNIDKYLKVHKLKFSCTCQCKK